MHLSTRKCIHEHMAMYSMKLLAGQWLIVVLKWLVSLRLKRKGTKPRSWDNYAQLARHIQVHIGTCIDTLYVEIAFSVVNSNDFVCK